MKKLAALLTGLCLVVISDAQSLRDYIPENAKLVLTFKPLQLASKVPAETFRQSFIYRELMKDPSSPPAKIFSEILNSGIHPMESFLVIFSAEEEQTRTVSIKGSLVNEKKFSDFIRKLQPGVEVKEEGANRYIFLGESILAWNDKLFSLVSLKGFDAGVESPFGSDTATVYEEMMPDTTVAVIEVVDEEIREEAEEEVVDEAAIEELTKAWEEYNEKVKVETEKALRRAGLASLTPNPGRGPGADPDLVSFLNQPGDVHIINLDPNGAMGRQLYPLPPVLQKLSSFSDGRKMTIIHFEKGKIVAKNSAAFTGELAELMQKHPYPSREKATLRNLPKGNILGYMDASFNPAFARAILKTAPFVELADSVKKYTNIDLEKFPAAFGQQMMMAVVQNEVTEDNTGVEFVIALPITDIAIFKPLAEQVKKAYDSLRSTMATADSKFNPVVLYNEKLMVFSLTKTAAQNYLDGSAVQPVPAWIDAYRQHPVFLQMDLREIIQLVFRKSGTHLSENAKQELDFTKKFDKILVYGGAMNGNAMTTTSEFIFSDPNGNSFAQLFELMNGFYEVLEHNASVREVEEAEMQSEDENIPPPPPPPVEMKKAKKDN